MCNSNNNNKSATSTNATPSVIELIKMASEISAIDDAANVGLYYSPIPISAIFHVNVGDFNISCNITNNAARDVDRNKQATAQTTQQESKATDHKQESKATTDNQQQKTTTSLQEEKFKRLYSLITDFIGSYTRVKISIAPGCSTDSIRLGFINKGESVVKEIKGETPFFGVESVPLQKYFSKNFESFSIFPRGDAFSVTIKGDEAAVSKLMGMVKEHIYKNKRAVELARYNY